jgi:phosphomevalonate kinase
MITIKRNISILPWEAFEVAETLWKDPLVIAVVIQGAGGYDSIGILLKKEHFSFTKGKKITSV